MELIDAAVKVGAYESSMGIRPGLFYREEFAKSFKREYGRKAAKALRDDDSGLPVLAAFRIVAAFKPDEDRLAGWDPTGTTENSFGRIVTDAAQSSFPGCDGQSAWACARGWFFEERTAAACELARALFHGLPPKSDDYSMEMRFTVLAASALAGQMAFIRHVFETTVRPDLGW